MRKQKIWFATGSQHLYGDETLKKVEENSRSIVQWMNENAALPLEIEYMKVLKTSEDIFKLLKNAEHDNDCIGLMVWMHTFSPAKMWIRGLKQLKKPLLHLHTQYNRDIPWGTIDMDFMNLNQSAHGDREFGFIQARMELNTKIVAGHWRDHSVTEEIGVWMRAAMGYYESSGLKIARFGDNMREVAVTEGDKIEAQIKFGWSVNGYGLGDLAGYLDSVPKADIDTLIEEYHSRYDMSEIQSEDDLLSVKEQAGIEAGIENFLSDGGFKAFTTTFENLYGIKQLPGLAVQRLMEKGYGFGAEGDWKTAAMVRIMKVMAEGIGKGTSFMEDYTYHLDPENGLVLGAHMLEVCPTLAEKRPAVEVHPLSIGGKKAPARLVFEGKPGSAINASIIDLGTRFRLIINLVDSVKMPEKTPNLPVARVLWKPAPSLPEAAKAWITAGGAHHTCFSYDLTVDHLTDWAEIAGIEVVVIDNRTDLRGFKNTLRINSVYWER